MAAATMSSSVRQPLGFVSESRLRTMTSTKNKQNAMPTTPSNPGKRAAPEDFEGKLVENIDPLQFFAGSSKKAKHFEFDDSFIKAPPFALTSNITPVKPAGPVQLAGSKRKAHDDSPSTHDAKRSQPSSAPAPAGRSPKHKRVGILSKRRATGSPFTRVNPPAFNAASKLPFSIDAALAGSNITMKSKSGKSTKGWSFEIHEDTHDDEMANLMEHSACTLDISDDEGQSSPTKGDRDNKENIAPEDYHVAVNLPAMRRDIMTDEIRAPLGDLETKDFYAEGCDATSFIIIPAEDEESDEAPEKAAAFSVDDKISPTHPSDNATTAVSGGHKGWEDPLAQAAKTSSTIDENPTDDKETEPEFSIWESESAKADDETDAVDLIAFGAAEAVTA